MLLDCIMRHDKEIMTSLGRNIVAGRTKSVTRFILSVSRWTMLYILVDQIRKKKFHLISA